MPKFKFFVFVFVLSALLILPLVVGAQGGSGNSVTPPPTDNLPAGSVQLPNPLGTSTTVEEVIGRVINTVMGVVGSLALLMFVYGGLVWMTSSGNEKKVTQGKGIITWAAIGLAVIFLSYAAVRFILTQLAG